jgi:hypothetical protein
VEICLSREGLAQMAGTTLFTRVCMPARWTASHPKKGTRSITGRKAALHRPNRAWIVVHACQSAPVCAIFALDDLPEK